MRAISVVAAFALGPGVVQAEPIRPPERSQHPRVGLLADVPFQRGADQLGWGSLRKLSRVAAWSQTNPDGVIVIEGHASKLGASQDNLDLSLRRAHSVRRELVEAGVPPARLIIAGYGEHGIQRGHNRRVAIWATRAGADAALALLEQRGAAVVRPGTDDASRVSRR